MSAFQKARNRGSVPILAQSQITEWDVTKNCARKKYGTRDEKRQVEATVRTQQNAIAMAAPER